MVRGTTHVDFKHTNYHGSFKVKEPTGLAEHIFHDIGQVCTYINQLWMDRTPANNLDNN